MRIIRSGLVQSGIRIFSRWHSEGASRQLKVSKRGLDFPDWFRQECLPSRGLERTMLLFRLQELLYCLAY
jgi:hypothetical protein